MSFLNCYLIHFSIFYQSATLRAASDPKRLMALVTELQQQLVGLRAECTSRVAAKDKEVAVSTTNTLVHHI